MQELQEKIRENIKVSPDTSCWLWQGALHKQGYGRVWYKTKTLTAHRASFTAFKGEIAEGLVVRHTCDVPTCCNPEHLEVGTQQDNMDDKHTRGRAASGENNGRAILTWKEVREIRASYIPRKVTRQYLAEKYGVTLAAIKDIIQNVTWKEKHYDIPK